LEIEPSLLEPRFELLELYKGQGKSDIIVRTYEDILKNNPLNIRAALELGLIYWKEGRKKDAKNLFQEMGRRSNNEFDVVLKVIQTYLEPDRYNDAIVVVEGLLEGTPDNPDLHHLAGVAYYGVKKNDEALRHFSEVTPESRFYQDAVVHLAFLYREKDMMQESIELMEKAIERYPDNPEFTYYLGTFYEDSEENEKAVELLKRSVELKPEETKYHFRLGVVYDKWGRKEDSIEAMKTVIKLDPEDANALNYLGYTYADLGKNLDEAERLIKRALEYKPDDGYITDSLGWVYYKKGNYAKALETLKKAVDLVPDDPVILEHLGDAYLKAGDRDNARQAYERALEKKHKDRPAIEEKIKKLLEQP
jgi:tetratricopeptide (TPR) repeat protein